MADVREDSSEDSSDSTSSDNFSIYTETSSSEEDLQNVEEPRTSTSSETTHNSHKGKSKSSSKQPTVKRCKRQQSFFVGKAYLKINSLVKTPLHEITAVACSGLWVPDNGDNDDDDENDNVDDDDDDGDDNDNVDNVSDDDDDDDDGDDDENNDDKEEDKVLKPSPWMRSSQFFVELIKIMNMEQVSLKVFLFVRFRKVVVSESLVLK